jgi:hypothetical protein
MLLLLGLRRFAFASETPSPVRALLPGVNGVDFYE